jgi:hypothetical protein
MNPEPEEIRIIGSAGPLCRERDHKMKGFGR